MHMPQFNLGHMHEDTAKIRRNIMRKSIKVLTAVLAVATVGAVAAFAGCGSVEEQTFRFEAENAILASSEEGEELGSQYMTAVEEDVESASGEASVGYFCADGNTITFVINSDRKVEGATLTLCAASSTLDSSWANMADYDATEHPEVLSVNGANVSLSGVLEGCTFDWTDFTGNYYHWGTLTATIDLVKGENTIVLTCDNTYESCINVDYIEITAAANLTWTETDNT